MNLINLSDSCKHLLPIIDFWNEKYLIQTSLIIEQITNILFLWLLMDVVTAVNRDMSVLIIFGLKSLLITKLLMYITRIQIKLYQTFLLKQFFDLNLSNFKKKR